MWLGGIGQQEGLRDGSEHGEHTGGGKGSSAVAAEFSGARDLAANAGDIAERLVERMDRESSSELTLHCKVNQSRGAVKLRA